MAGCWLAGRWLSAGRACWACRARAAGGHAWGAWAWRAGRAGGMGAGALGDTGAGARARGALERAGRWSARARGAGARGRGALERAGARQQAGRACVGAQTNLEAILQRCIEKKLVLNWEKCHFMVNQGIVLGHVISSRGIEVDKAKIDIISKLPHPTNVKTIRQFLGHAGFYRRFIKDFAKIAKPLYKLLEKDAQFI